MTCRDLGAGTACIVGPGANTGAATFLPEKLPPPSIILSRPPFLQEGKKVKTPVCALPPGRVVLTRPSGVGPGARQVKGVRLPPLLPASCSSPCH